MSVDKNLQRFFAFVLQYVFIFLDVFRILIWCSCLLCVSIFRVFIPESRKSVIGRVVLITGSANGMGKYLARNFSKLGARVVLWDVDQQSNLKLQNELRKNGAEAWAFKVDVSDEAQVEEIGRQVKRDIGDVDVLVNNAGVMPGKPIMLLNSYQIKRTLEINTLAHFWTVRHFLPRMIEMGGGHIVAVASIAGYAGCANLSDYCASKHGVIGFMSALREDLHVQGKEDVVNLTVACPCAMYSGMAQYPKSRFPSVFSIAHPRNMADLITDGILRNKKFIMPPAFNFLFTCTSVLPLEAVVAGKRFLDYSIDPNDR